MRADDVDLRVLLGQRLVDNINNVVRVVDTESEITKYFGTKKTISKIIQS